jgi:hypothetical protein
MTSCIPSTFPSSHSNLTLAIEHETLVLGFAVYTALIQMLIRVPQITYFWTSGRQFYWKPKTRATGNFVFESPNQPNAVSMSGGCFPKLFCPCSATQTYSRDFQHSISCPNDQRPLARLQSIPGTKPLTHRPLGNTWDANSSTLLIS